jgi:hypothetical protein
LKKKKHQNLAQKCEKIPESYNSYLDILNQLFKKNSDHTCASQHVKCGWSPRQEEESNDLPLFVFVTGIEGSGHHLWDALLTGVLDCSWV